MIGASVCPMKTLAVAASVSAPLVPISGIMARASSRTAACRTPRW